MRSFARSSLLCGRLVAGSDSPELAAKTAATIALQAIGGGGTGCQVCESPQNTVISGRVAVVHAGDAPGTASLDAVDATTGATTGPVYEQATKDKADVGAWVSLDAWTVTFNAGASALVGFA
jgi:hypothetical protein